MANDSITIYKLIILYTLSKVNTPLPQGIISDYIINHGYTNYFNVQTAFGELLQADLIKEDTTYHLAYYGLTSTGHETLDSFEYRLSSDIREEINTYLKEHRFDIINETALISDYQLNESGAYLATCSLRENNQVIFSLSLEVATEDDAVCICENWKSESQNLYQFAMKQLLSKKNLHK